MNFRAIKMAVVVASAFVSFQAFAGAANLVWGTLKQANILGQEFVSGTQTLAVVNQMTCILDESSSRWASLSCNNIDVAQGVDAIKLAVYLQDAGLFRNIGTVRAGPNTSNHFATGYVRHCIKTADRIKCE
jgi:hypothetical protein